MLGLALRAWAAGHLEKNLALTESGPYAHVRNPLYIGTLTVAAGFAIAARRWELGVLFAAVFVLIYLPVVELEEQHLRKLFPDYEEYARRCRSLFRDSRGAGAAKRFEWRCTGAIASMKRSRDFWREWRCWCGRRWGDGRRISIRVAHGTTP